MSHGPAARRFLRRHHDGALSTISVKLQGYPFGSVSPFVTRPYRRAGHIISKLAEHTRNIDADGRVSLLVQDKEANAQAAGRLTVIGDAKPLTGMNALLQARYLNYFPTPRGSSHWATSRSIELSRSYYVSSAVLAPYTGFRGSFCSPMTLWRNASPKCWPI